MNLSQAQWEGLIRAVMICLTSITGTLGILNSVPWATITSVVVGVIPLVWSLKSNSVTGLVKQAAQSADVHKVLMASSADALAIPSSKVVGPTG